MYICLGRGYCICQSALWRCMRMCESAQLRHLDYSEHTRTCPCLQVDYRMLYILATLEVVLILPFFAHVIYALYVWSSLRTFSWLSENKHIHRDECWMVPRLSSQVLSIKNPQKRWNFKPCMKRELTTSCMRRLRKSEKTCLGKPRRPYHHEQSKCVRDMNELKSNKVGINDTKELDEEKIVAHTLHLH